jgi:hypothetical protein
VEGKEMNEISPEATQPGPRPFSQIPPLWLKFFRMDLVFFDIEKEYSSVRNTLLGVLCLMILGPIQFGISYLATSLSSGNQIFSPQFIPQSNILYIFLCFSMMLIPISFYLSAGVTFLGTLILGGKGKFSNFAYLLSIIFVPSYILSALVGIVAIIPQIGECLMPVLLLPLVIYGIILQVRAIKVVHGFGTGKALLAIFLPFVVLWSIACVLIVILSLLGPAIGSVFSGITESI